MDEPARTRPCAPPPLPAAMAAGVDGYRWARDRVGESGGAVYRLHSKPRAPDLFPKHGAGTIADDVSDEMARLRWLRGHLPVPAVMQFVATPDAAWLLMTALPGQTVWQLLAADRAARPAIVDALADFLHRLHAVPVHECPFTSDHRLRLARARTRIEAGLVETGEFDAARAGWTAEQVWGALQELLPLAPDPVVTHGDFSLDNILLHDGAVTGCIDAGRVGIADRYQDLAILWNCLGEFDSALQARLFHRYGIAEPDRRKLDFHLLLDELF